MYIGTRTHLHTHIYIYIYIYIHIYIYIYPIALRALRYINPCFQCQEVDVQMLFWDAFVAA